jgi:hypothetical protein
VSQPQHQGQLQELSPRASANAQGRERNLNLDDIEIEVVQDPLHGIRRGSLDEISMVPDPILSLVTVSVVLPTLNEADNLPHVFERMPSDVFEVILVDGDSTDGTVEVAKELWPGLTVIKQSAKGKRERSQLWLLGGDRAISSSCSTPTDLRIRQRYPASLRA